jgi:hypothetical protein
MGSMTAAASYGFNRGMRALVQQLVRRRSSSALRTGAPQTWRTFSDDFKNPGYVPVISVLAPRWNCHALLATLSPLRVERTLTLELAGFAATADAWSLVLYDEFMKTCCWTGSAVTHESTVTWQVRPGIYSLSLRYYADGDDIDVPTVVVDGSSRIPGGTIAGEAHRHRRNLETIRARDGRYYRLLHYYAFYHLSREHKSRDWLLQQFLPVANPDTEFDCGHLEVGEQLQIRSDVAHHRAYNTYVCFYNWSSFPVEWCRIRSAEWCSRTFDQPVAYAIRNVRKRPAELTPAATGHFEAFRR